MVSAAFEQLVTAVESAKRIPLTSQIRIDPEEVLCMLESARAELPRAVAQFERLEQLIAAGRPVPLSAEVRIDRLRALSPLKEARKLEPAALQFFSEES